MTLLACSKPPVWVALVLLLSGGFWGFLLKGVLALMATEPVTLESIETVLGELIDALHDEMAYEVSQNTHVLDHVQKACVLLGEPYWAYIGSWL